MTLYEGNLTLPWPNLIDGWLYGYGGEFEFEERRIKVEGPILYWLFRLLVCMEGDHTLTRRAIRCTNLVPTLVLRTMYTTLTVYYLPNLAICQPILNTT